MNTSAPVRLTFQTVSEVQADHPLAGYEPFEGEGWSALLAPGIGATELTPDERQLIIEAALGARREGRVLIVELAMPAGA